METSNPQQADVGAPFAPHHNLDEVRSALDHILATRHFCNSAVLSRFLRYAVEQTLQGNAERLKEYLLGIDVFGRTASFDPRIEPVVRTAARRVRARLEAYYESDGRYSTIRIEIPKGGYAAVITEKAPEPAPAQAQAPPSSVSSEEPPIPNSALGRRATLFWAILLSLCVLGVAWFFLRKGERLSSQDAVLLAEFSNSTGDPIFDDALQTALRISLQQSPFLNMLAEEKVAATLQLMGRPAGARMTAALTRELCQRAGSKAYIGGAISSLGTDYILQLKAVDCQTGNTLAEEQTAASSKEGVLPAIGSISAKLRNELGESLATVQKYDVPLVTATTSSLEALKVFSTGQAVYRERGPEASLPFDLRAIAIDPEFAMAHFQAGSDYHSLYQVSRARDSITRAFELRDRVSERERLAIEAFYYRNVTGELEKALQLDEEETETFPKELYGYIRLGVDHATLGQWERARDATLHATRLIPDHSVAVGNLASMELALNDFSGVRQTIQRAMDRGIDNLQFHTALYAMSFLGGDLEGMAQQRRWFDGTSDEAIGLALAADTEGYAGHLVKAGELATRALISAIRSDGKENGAVWQENNALRDAAYGLTYKARQEAEAGLGLAPDSIGVQLEAGLAFAMIRDRSRAEEIEQNLNRSYPADTQVQSLWLPTIRAQLALNQNDAVAALANLQSASTIELGLTPFVNNLSCLNSIYVQAQANLQAGRASAAAAAFQQIVNHSGLVWNCWTGALAQLGLARANALEARNASNDAAKAARTRALSDYRTFLALWKNADGDIPILNAAEVEYANLISQ